MVKRPDIRQAVVIDGFVTEGYFGVAFVAGASDLRVGRAGMFAIDGMYHPQLAYNSLVRGATLRACAEITFTISSCVSA